MDKILIVEDDKILNKGISLALKENEISIENCFSIKEAEKLIAKTSFDLIILDINLPDGNGLDLLMKIKNKQEVPVILLTANDLETDIVTGLSLGADDYITKPFSLAILRARAAVQLRKTSHKNAATVNSIYENSIYRFDYEKMEFIVMDSQVELSKTEQKLLRLLTENKGNVMSREKLIDRIWTDGSDFVDENALSVAIKRLRDKLNASEFIKTVYGIGYMWSEK